MGRRGDIHGKEEVSVRMGEKGPCGKEEQRGMQVRWQVWRGKMDA